MAFVRITMPGVQNPHCRAPWAANASAILVRSSADSPSNVVISAPALFSMLVWHATRALPSTSTVQQPH